jgi:hypothetical protein
MEFCVTIPFPAREGEERRERVERMARWQSETHARLQKTLGKYESSFTRAGMTVVSENVLLLDMALEMGGTIEISKAAL